MEPSPDADTEAVAYKAIGWRAVGPISECAGWHAHPVLGIEGHMHPRGDDAHVHLPKWEWDMEPSPIPREEKP